MYGKLDVRARREAMWVVSGRMAEAIPFSDCLPMLGLDIEWEEVPRLRRWIDAGEL